MKPKLIKCPACKKKFRKIGDLNRHITVTGCNDGKKVSMIQILGIDNKKAFLKQVIAEL